VIQDYTEQHKVQKWPMSEALAKRVLTHSTPIMPLPELAPYNEINICSTYAYRSEGFDVEQSGSAAIVLVPVV
jgi:hypothetical protein